MPFTLAHPAAALPFRRLCPRYFSFPALVIGSLSPDAGYCFGSLHLEDFSHSLTGSMEFCLPVALVMLGIFYGLRQPVVEHLPERHRKIYEPFCLHPAGPPLTVVVSLLAGIWIHLLLDSFTHKQGWVVENLPALQTVIFSVGMHELRVFHVIEYLCSFAGVAWLYFVWEKWQNEINGQDAGRGKFKRAALAGSLMLPAAFAHHLVHGVPGLCLTAGWSAIILIGLVWRTGNKKS
jgi:hypothetical protein